VIRTVARQRRFLIALPSGINLPIPHVRNVQRQYWVDAASGSDLFTEAQARDTESNAWATLQKAIDSYLNPVVGDVAINVKNTGTYQAAAGPATAFIDEGRSSVDHYLIVRRAQAAKPLVRLAAGAGNQHDAFQIRDGWVILDGFEIDSAGRPGQSAAGNTDGTGVYISKNTGADNGAIEIWNMDVHDLLLVDYANTKVQGFLSEPTNPPSPILFINNKVRDIGATVEGESLNDLEHGYYLHGNVWLINSLVYDIPNGFCVQTYDGGASVTKNYLVHCTLAFTTDQGLWTIDPRRSTNIHIRNSILYAAAAGKYNIANTQGGTPDTSSTLRTVDHVINKVVDGLGPIGNPQDMTISNHDTISEPGFIDANARNFHLVEGSAARGYVDEEWSPAFDLDGKMRIAGSVDAGCYQYAA